MKKRTHNSIITKIKKIQKELEQIEELIESCDKDTDNDINENKVLRAQQSKSKSVHVYKRKRPVRSTLERNNGFREKK